MYEEIEANKRNSFLLVAFFFLFLLGFGAIIAAATADFWFSFILFMVVALIITTVQYFMADKEILMISKAKPATKKEHPTFVNAVEGLSIAAGIPLPKMYVINDTAINAFATGRDPEHASVVVTTGIIQRLNRTELEAVVAHEMAHIKNFDIRMMMFTAVMAGIITLISDLFLRSMFYSRGNKKGGNVIFLIIGIIFAILAPIAAMLIKMAISRQREYLADASGVLLTRYPPALASALKKISQDKEILEVANRATAHLYIANPLKNVKGFAMKLFSTHPPIQERIKRLEAM